MSTDTHFETETETEAGFVDWQPVTIANGPLAAAVIVGRLQSAGIPAWARHESAGPAIGLSLAPLAYSQIMVPVEQLTEAEALLDETPPPYDEPVSPEELMPTDPGPLEKAVMLAAAVTINSLGTIIAFMLAPLLGKPGAEYIVCPGCQTDISLNEAQIDAGWVNCPDCTLQIEFD